MAAAEKDIPMIRQTRLWFDSWVQFIGTTAADAAINTMTTVKGTNTTTAMVGVMGATAVPENMSTWRRQLREAMLVALSLQVFGATEAASDTAVAAANTVAGMRALWNTALPALSATLSELQGKGPLPLGPLSPLA
jgi:hypothetical protein